MLEIVAYDPDWPARFAAERERVLAVFEPEGAVLEHVGSTAVPGLGAKPIIDMLLGVGRLAEVEARIPALGALGYEYLPRFESRLPERRFFVGVAPGGCTHHLHAVEIGGMFWQRHLLFRDCLRAEPETVAAYERLKRGLARRHADDREAYTEAKANFIEVVLERASAARLTGRAPAPTGGRPRIVEAAHGGEPVRLYDYGDSGNGYKVRLLLAQLGRSYEYVEVDILAGESRTEEFLARNPNGRIPVLEREDGSFLAESNAILFHLAEGTRFLPEDALERARALQWMFFEQYSHEPYVATSRFWLRHTELTPWHRERLLEKREGGEAALAVMERHLAERPFFVADRYSIADIALYAYTHVAPEGGFSLDRLPAVRTWLARVAEQPGHVPMSP